MKGTMWSIRVFGYVNKYIDIATQGDDISLSNAGPENSESKHQLC